MFFGQNIKSDIDVFIISNTNNRNDQFMPFFKQLLENGYGSMSEKQFCISSSINFQPIDEITMKLSLILKQKNSDGIETICFDI